METSLITHYLDYERGLGRSRATIRRRRWTLRNWQRHLDGQQAGLGTATLGHAESFLARWQAPQTRKSVRSDLRMFYEWARIHEMLDCGDPTERTPRVKVPRRGATPVPAPAVRQLIDSCTDRRDRLAVMLAAYAGLRVAEISRLRGEDADLDARRLSVLGKGGTRLTVPLSMALAVELDAWPRHGRLLTINAASVSRRIRSRLRALGIPRRPHDLRHSFATQAARASNGNVVLVCQLMRHADISTTMRYIEYGEEGRDVVDALSAA